MIKFLDIQKNTAKYSGEIHQAIQKVVNSGWYLLGNEVKTFESHYADFIGTKYAIGVANGLDALRLILRAYIEMGVMHEGDEVIVPANTYIASILAITDNRLVPVLVEPSLEFYEIDDTKVEQAITDKTKALMIVHLYGQCAYTENIKKLCQKYNLKLIEDNAQAQGCYFNDVKRTGALGDAAGHSFYPGKNLGALGDAGAITTDDDELARVVRALANYGSNKKYVFDYCGLNSRLDEIQATVLKIKLKYLEKDNNLRRMVAKEYINRISNPEIILPVIKDWNEHVFHLFVVRCKRRDELQHYLEDRGIQTLIHYPIPPHKQHCYKNWRTFSFPITEQIHREILSLPISPVLEDFEIDKIIESINEFR